MDTERILGAVYDLALGLSHDIWLGIFCTITTG
jgi:hypothetical protein